MEYKGKKILITGGTGSCGHLITHRLIQKKAKEILILSRDEKKHFDMQHEFREFPQVKFMIGDIRDYARINEAMSSVDIVFQTAAMKHVNQCQQNPFEAAKTNILGIQNVINAALENKVDRVISLSTDKAVEPVNTMGMTKAIGENLITAANISPKNKGTKLCSIRYGNVMNSRGSVIPFFRHMISTGQTVPITDHEMTRFMLTLGEAADLVFFAAENLQGGEIFVRKAPSVYIKDIAEVLAEEKGAKLKTKEIGIFPGEKIHETLISSSEMNRAKEQKDYWVITANNIDSKKGSKKEYCSKNELVPKSQIPALLKRADAEHKQSHSELTLFNKEGKA